MAAELSEILERCNLEQHYQYLSAKGFGSWESLQLLDQSDFAQLSAIPYGHFKLLIQTIQKYANEQHSSSNTIRPKYKQFLKSLDKIPKPEHLFPSIDEQINKYQQIKQQYLENWMAHKQYHSKISAFLKNKSEIESNAPLKTTEIEKYLQTMHGLNDSLQHLLHNFANPNDESKIDTDNNIKPSNAKRESMRIKTKKKQQQSMTKEWSTNEELSLIEDVELYAAINLMETKDLNKRDWKTIIVEHNLKFWNNSSSDGRTYKEGKKQYKEASKKTKTNTTMGMNEMNGEMEEDILQMIVESGDDNKQNEMIQVVDIAEYNNKNVNVLLLPDENDSSSSSDDDDAFGFLSQMTPQ